MGEPTRKGSPLKHQKMQKGFLKRTLCAFVLKKEAIVLQSLVKKRTFSTWLRYVLCPCERVTRIDTTIFLIRSATEKSSVLGWVLWRKKDAHGLLSTAAHSPMDRQRLNKGRLDHFDFRGSVKFWKNSCFVCDVNLLSLLFVEQPFQGQTVKRVAPGSV